jgi:hypothetical protein
MFLYIQKTFENTRKRLHIIENKEIFHALCIKKKPVACFKKRNSLKIKRFHKFRGEIPFSEIFIVH